MLDLSNNNGDPARIDFRAAYEQGGQRRVYLKCTEGTGFVDGRYLALREKARLVGLEVGAYAFLHPLAATPRAAAAFFLEHMQGTGPLRPALDCEFGIPSPAVGHWITQVASLVAAETRAAPLIYGSSGYLHACSFRIAPGSLWLAAYGRNDGREYPAAPPPPWGSSSYAAHQFTSRAHVIGIDGYCDLSHVLLPALVEFALANGAGCNPCSARKIIRYGG